MSKKYIFAALLVVVGTVLAADLGSLLDLIKGGYAIVIGKAAKVDDVLAAVDLATRLAQAYSVEKTVTLPIEIAPEYEIKGWEARLELNSRSLLGGFPGFLEKYGSSELPQLKKINVRNGTLTIIDVPEEVIVENNEQLGAEIYRNATLQLVLTKGTSYVKYYVDLTGKGCVFPDILSGSLVRLKLAGKDIVISDIKDGRVTLLEGFGPEWLNVKDERTVGNYKVRLDDVIGFGDDAIVKVSVLDSNGNVVGVLSPSPKSYDTEPVSGIKIVVVRAFGFGDTKMAYMLAGIETTVDSNTRLDSLFKWYVTTQPQGTTHCLQKLGYVLVPNDTVYVKVGEEVAFPNNYLKLKFLGLTASDKDYLATLVFRPVEIDTNKVYKVEKALRNNGPANLQSIIVDKRALEISNVQFLVKSAADDQKYLARKVYVVNVSYTLDGSNTPTTTAVFLYYDERTGNYTAATSVSIPIMNINNVDNEYDSDIGRVTVQIGTGVTVRYDFSRLYYSGTNNYEIHPEVDLNNTWVYTAYGHKVFLSADGKELRLAYTPVKVYARVVLGDVVEKTSKVQREVKVTELDKERLKVPVAYFDDEELREDVPVVIAVGGPVVNRVAAEVLGLPYGDFEAAKKFFENATAVDKAIIKVGEYKGKKALVVAGWRASDTRFACQLLQRFDEFAELKGKTAVVVGGTLESPTITELKA
jgi:hypothetical protein